jgi:hypothetical protein
MATNYACRWRTMTPEMKRTSETFDMWLPAPLYESLPYLYVLGGVLFLSGTLYIGVNAPASPLYIACGLTSIVYGAYIFKRRIESRRLNIDPGDITPA